MKHNTRRAPFARREMAELEELFVKEFYEGFGERNAGELSAAPIPGFEETDDILGAFCGWLRAKLPPVVCLRENGKRFEEVIGAIAKLEDFFRREEPSAVFQVRQDPLLGTTLSLSVTCALLSVSDPKEFARLIAGADSFEATPLTDGTTTPTTSAAPKRRRSAKARSERALSGENSRAALAKQRKL